MTTETKSVEVLASWSGRGDYDLRRQSRVVARGGKHYLVHDGYCGEDGLRGGAFRPFVYEIPPALVVAVVDLVTHGDDDAYEQDAAGDFFGHPSKIRKLEHEILGELKLKDLGEQGALNWTTEL